MSFASHSATLDKPLERWLSTFRFSRWSIGTRIGALVLTLVVPLNVVVFVVIWHLAESASEAQRTSLVYTAQSVAAAVDARLGEYVSLAEALASSPVLLDDNLNAFDAEARRIFNSVPEASVLVTDPKGQQLKNAVSEPDLSSRSSFATAAQKQAFETRSTVVTDLEMDPVMRVWIANIVVPVFKDGQPFRALAVRVKTRSFLRLLDARQLPKNWIATIIDSQGRIIARAGRSSACLPARLLRTGYWPTPSSLRIELKPRPLLSRPLIPPILATTMPASTVSSMPTGRCSGSHRQAAPFSSRTKLRSRDGALYSWQALCAM
jgi:hypothetical protein